MNHLPQWGRPRGPRDAHGDHAQIRAAAAGAGELRAGANMLVCQFWMFIPYKYGS